MKKMFKDKTLIIKISIFISCLKQEKRPHLLGKIYYELPIVHHQVIKAHKILCKNKNKMPRELMQNS